jgi:glycosyltransferase involved in cell wall biosynthesis
VRILISAYACAPHRGSEPGIGWGVVCQAAPRHSVCVLTSAFNRKYIEEEIAARELPGAQFVFIRSPLGFHRLVNIPWIHYLHYFIWQLRAYWTARRLHKQEGFDLVHHVTYVNSWAPSFMGWLGIPFVWCAGASTVTPWRFWRVLSWRSRIREAVRNVTMKVFGIVTRYLTASRASVILSSSPSQWDSALPVREFLLGGLDAVEVAKLQSLPERSTGPFRLASIGWLLGFKGFSLGLAAFAAFRKELPDSEYWIIGDGPERRRLEEQARRLGCADKVRFLGWMPPASLMAMLSEVDVLVHPSLHEQFGYVALEAMTAGRPVVCLKSGGCGKLVSDGGGIAIPMSTPEEVVSALCDALLELARDPAQRLQRRRATGGALSRGVEAHGARRFRWSCPWSVTGAVW